MILKDVDDVAKIFFQGEEVMVRDAIHHELLTRRTSQPHLRLCPDAVPRHLWDPQIYNDYPHVMLKRNNVQYAPSTSNGNSNINSSSSSSNAAQHEQQYIDTNGGDEKSNDKSSDDYDLFA